MQQEQRQALPLQRTTLSLADSADANPKPKRKLRVKSGEE